MSEEGRAAAARALEGVDKVLAQRPHKDDAGLTEVAKQLCVFRDALIARRAEPDSTSEDGRRLGHVNAVLSLVLAVQFPLGEVPWDEFAKGRDWLADLQAGASPD